jgi:hypothetical protein
MGRSQDARTSGVTEYRVRLAEAERDLAKAERLQRLNVDWFRERARAALATAPEHRDEVHRNAIRSLAVSIQGLADIQREHGEAGCVENLREAFDLNGVIGEPTGQATCAFNLGKVYTRVAALRDLGAAERWLKQSLELLPLKDVSGRGKVLVMLGNVSAERFYDALRVGQPDEERSQFLVDAERYYQQALQLYPASR